MDLSNVIAQIDDKIDSLQQARALLARFAEPNAEPKPKLKRGRPKGSTNVKTAQAVKTAKPATAKKVVTMAKPAKHTLSPEGRKRIAEAMKQRWAQRRRAIKKAAKKEVLAKKEPVVIAK
jgi:hypothetical protein